MITVTLAEKRTLLEEWKQPSDNDLPSLLQAFKIVKLSINEYLTDLVYQNRGFPSNNQAELAELSDVEEDSNDRISGLIKHVNRIHEECAQLEKRKACYSNRAKKIKQ